MKYRKKPVVIEAVKVTAADFNGSSFDGSPFSESPEWLLEAIKHNKITIHPSDRDYAEFKIQTLEDGSKGEATHIASAGDYIIRGVKGELYPCKPDIFEMTYEPVEDNP